MKAERHAGDSFAPKTNREHDLRRLTVSGAGLAGGFATLTHPKDAPAMATQSHTSQAIVAV